MNTAICARVLGLSGQRAAALAPGGDLAAGEFLDPGARTLGRRHVAEDARAGGGVYAEPSFVLRRKTAICARVTGSRAVDVDTAAGRDALAASCSIQSANWLGQDDV